MKSRSCLAFHLKFGNKILSKLCEKYAPTSLYLHSLSQHGKARGLEGVHIFTVLVTLGLTYEGFPS